MTKVEHTQPQGSSGPASDRQAGSRGSGVRGQNLKRQGGGGRSDCRREYFENGGLQLEEEWGIRLYVPLAVSSLVDVVVCDVSPPNMYCTQVNMGGGDRGSYFLFKTSVFWVVFFR